MASNSIDRCIVHPAHGFSRDAGQRAFQRVNDWTAEYWRQAPDLVLAATGVIDPRNRSSAVTEVERCVTELGMCGLCFHHHFLGTYINDPAMDPILECVRELQCLVFIHVVAGSALEDIWRLFDLADRFPDVRFVAMDGFSSPTQSGQILANCTRFDNIWYDTAVMISVGHGLEEFVKRHGPDKLLFGSDRYSGGGFNVPYGLAEVRAMHMTDSVRSRILGGNIQTLINELGSAPRD